MNFDDLEDIVKLEGAAQRIADAIRADEIALDKIRSTLLAFTAEEPRIARRLEARQEALQKIKDRLLDMYRERRQR